MSTQLMAGVGIVALGLLTLAAAGYLAWKNGSLRTEKGYIQRDLEAAKRVSQAATDAPTTRDDLVKRLRDHERGL